MVHLNDLRHTQRNGYHRIGHWLASFTTAGAATTMQSASIERCCCKRYLGRRVTSRMARSVAESARFTPVFVFWPRHPTAKSLRFLEHRTTARTKPHLGEDGPQHQAEDCAPQDVPEPEPAATSSGTRVECVSSAAVRSAAAPLTTIPSHDTPGWCSRTCDKQYHVIRPRFDHAVDSLCYAPASGLTQRL
jgi:hypothetical protein